MGIDGAESIIHGEERAGVSRIFERALWDSRLLVIVAVVASAVLALGAFWIALVARVHCFAFLEC